MDAAVIDALRNAAASDNLLLVTGAGISRNLRRSDGSPLPGWGELVTSLRLKADQAALEPHAALLDELLPSAGLAKVHGDALIEASEIIQKEGFANGVFEQEIAKLCREKPGDFTETHRAIAQIAPAGIITFNYDQGHEWAFQAMGMDFQPVRYDEGDKLKGLLAADRPGAPFVLKAHGCIAHPESLVLTSSSYRRVLSSNRAYRLFLQHCFARYTVLIAGFSLRDRDFDQLLSVLEIELGRPIHTHAFIEALPDRKTEEGLLKRAHWASLTARFGLRPLYVDDFAGVPNLLRQLGDTAGTLIGQLVNQSASADGRARAAAHDRTIRLGRIGRAQMRSALLGRLDDRGLPLPERSELIYAFRGIVEGDVRVHERLLRELGGAAQGASAPNAAGHAECAAHALVVIRGLRLPDAAERHRIQAVLEDAGLLQNLQKLDSACAVPRLHGYAIAAAAELRSRHSS